MICQCLADQLLIIELLATDKSLYFAQPRPIIVKYLLTLAVRVNFCVCSLEKSYVRKLLTSVSSPKQCLIITKTWFWWFLYCFCSFGEFAKVFERLQVWRVRVVICIVQRMRFQVRVGVFTLSTNLDKDLLRCLFLLRYYHNFNQRQKATNIMCVSFT